jgi:predicted nucleotidyltransferase
MVYTEVRNIKGRKYYYRVSSVRKGKKVSKERVYLGNNLSNSELSKREKAADERLLSKKKEKINKEIEKIKPKIISVLKKYNIERAGLFGSYVRGEQKKGSDIDILIQPTKDMSLLDLSEIKLDSDLCPG